MQHRFSAVALAALPFLLGLPASAEKWLKIDPNDPYSKDGSFHMFDIDSAIEDRATGYVAARASFGDPEEISKKGVPADNGFLWAFDCTGNAVFYVVSGSTVSADWRSKPYGLEAPLMGGVTNLFGRRLCALKGSLPRGDLP